MVVVLVVVVEVMVVVLEVALVGGHRQSSNTPNLDCKTISSRDFYIYKMHYIKLVRH